MASFDLSFRSMFIKEIVEDEGSLWTEGSTSGLSINRGSYHDNRVQVVDVSSRSYVGVRVFPGAAYCRAGSRSVSIFWSLFRVSFANKTQNPKNRTVCRPTFYLRLTIPLAN